MPDFFHSNERVFLSVKSLFSLSSKQSPLNRPTIDATWSKMHQVLTALQYLSKVHVLWFLCLQIIPSLIFYGLNISVLKHIYPYTTMSKGYDFQNRNNNRNEENLTLNLRSNKNWSHKVWSRLAYIISPIVFCYSVFEWLYSHESRTRKSYHDLQIWHEFSVWLHFFK